MNYIVTKATEQHIQDMLPIARDADRREVAVFGLGMEEALVASLRDAVWARAGVTEDGVACIWGVRARSILGGIGVPWLIGSEVLTMKKYRRAFLVESRKQVAEMQQMFPILLNYVDEDNVDALRWLQWLGFDLREADAVRGVRLVPFQMGE